MKTTRLISRFIFPLSLGLAGLISPGLARAADRTSPLPSVIQAGFDSWSKGGGFNGALYIWQKGGLMEGDHRTAELSNRLQSMSQTLGGYSGYELLKTDSIGSSSQVLYLSMNFQRGAVFGRFVLYRTEKGWVVQDMGFSTRPEAIMPWLSFAGDRNTE